MTIYAIKDAIKSFKRLYIDSNEVEILFFDELTETIEVRFINTNKVTFVTKLSLSDEKESSRIVKIDDLLILRYREVIDV